MADFDEVRVGLMQLAVAGQQSEDADTRNAWGMWEAILVRPRCSCTHEVNPAEGMCFHCGTVLGGTPS